MSNSAVVPESGVLLGGDILILSPKESFDSLFLSYYVSNCKKKEIAKKACGISIIHSHSSEIAKLLVHYPSLDEQKDIAALISLISKKGEIIDSKIKTLKKYKKGLENKAFTFVNLSKERLKFSELFEIKNIRNKEYLKQYAVGKYGIKEMNEEKYDISNHKIFSNEDLIIGIGIEEIGISDNITGCVSPVYDVFSIAKPEYFQSLKWTLKNQLWRKRRFISKKSTRREFEVDKSELMKFNIAIISNSDFYYYYHAFDNINNAINCLELLKLKLLKTKSFFLSNMFV